MTQAGRLEFVDNALQSADLRPIDQPQDAAQQIMLVGGAAHFREERAGLFGKKSHDVVSCWFDCACSDQVQRRRAGSSEWSRREPRGSCYDSSF
jgi:hypothetical protein